jgi:hypothetical protein
VIRTCPVRAANAPAATTIPSVAGIVAELVHRVRVDRRVRADDDALAARRDLVADDVERARRAPTAPVAMIPPIRPRGPRCAPTRQE